MMTKEEMLQLANCLTNEILSIDTSIEQLVSDMQYMSTQVVSTSEYGLIPISLMCQNLLTLHEKRKLCKNLLNKIK